MQKLKILTLGCNSILGFNFTKNILKNKKIIFYGTINKNSYRLNTDPLTRKLNNIKKYNPILHSKKLIRDSLCSNRIHALYADMIKDTIDGKEGVTMTSLNELLIKEGHAKEYFGGKR